MYKLHFPLGWFRAVCVRDSCQPSLTKLFLSLSTSRSSFYSIPFSSVSPTLLLDLCVSQGLEWTCQFLQQHLAALQ